MSQNNNNNNNNKINKLKQNTYKTPHLNRSGVTYNYLKSGNSGARLTMKLGIMEEKLT